MTHSTDPYVSHSDEELLAKLRQGDRDVFGSLVRRYERELYGYLRRYLGDSDLASDVFQNTFLAVFLKIQQYEQERPARPWLYTIATNQAIDALRRQTRRNEKTAFASANEENYDEPRPTLELANEREQEPSDRVIALEQQQMVRDTVDKLPDILKQVVILAYFQGLKYSDIADILGIPLGTVKSRLHAALAKLAEAWSINEPAPHET